MARGKSSKVLPWERLMMLMLDGKIHTKEESMKKINYEYGYRISSLVFSIKECGGIVKSYKNGRTVTGYELKNPEDCKKYFKNRGIAIQTFDQIESLDDLGAKQVAAKTDELIVEEITE